MNVEDIARGLTDGERRIILHPRFDPKGWEPGNPFTGRLCAMVDKGLFRRADGRCGFEAFKDSFIIPTALCLQVRAFLRDEPHDPR